MTILSKNLKILRKSLSCTQMAFSKVLDIGFRTYVRYEAGERDAPISILIKIARLGNISLDRLLTTELTLDDLKIPDEDAPPAVTTEIPTIGGSIESGRLMFKGIIHDYLVCTQPFEKKLIELFRKVDRPTKERILLDAEWFLKKHLKAKKKSNPLPLRVLKEKNAVRLKKAAKAIKQITFKG